mgnify:CR=1 FL=1
MSALLLILPDQLSKNNKVLDFLKDDNLLTIQIGCFSTSQGLKSIL